MIRNSAIFAGLTLASRLLGFVRDLAISAKLGASQTIAADAYYTALSFPNLFRRVLAEGPLAAAFLPAYSRKLTAEGSEAADQLAANTLATVAAATVAVTVIAQLSMPWLMILISHDYYVNDPAKFKLAVILTQITMPYLPCMAIAALFAAVLNARGRFVISGAYPIVLNVVMLAAILPQDDPVVAARWVSWSVLVAGVSQAALVWWGARRSGARVMLMRPRLTPELKALIKRAVPTMISSSATQLNIFISMLLSGQVAGMRAWMNYADRLYQLPMSLVGVAIGVALLPRLSQALAAEDHDDAQTAMDQGIVFALAFSLPAAAALVAMPLYLVDGLFTRGEFVFKDAQATASLLFHYGWGVPAFVLLRILQPAFFARQDTSTPMRFALVSVAVNIVLGVSLFYLIGFTGIAIATSVAAWINVIQMATALRRRDMWRPSARAASKMIRVGVASLVLGVLLALAQHYRPVLEAPLDAAGLGVLGKEITLVLVCAIGGGLYPLLLFAFGGVTPAEVKGALRRRGRPAADLPPAD